MLISHVISMVIDFVLASLQALDETYGVCSKGLPKILRVEAAKREVYVRLRNYE